MSNKILVPLALADYKNSLFQFAVEQARKTNADLILVHVIEEKDVKAIRNIASYGFHVNEEQLLQSIRQDKEEKFARLLKVTDYPHEKITNKLLVGDPVDELLQFAIREDVDMIIMGIRGKSDLLHTFTGSVANTMFRRSPISILSYRDPISAERLRKRID
ncbi:MAG: universal stress protein [Proteobacteria bacterium]|nr:universal stress protein [Pseudomonadota bacterium]MBU1056799.1 universal stress protein [Pseudomonadota bacterium]